MLFGQHSDPLHKRKTHSGSGSNPIVLHPNWQSVQTAILIPSHKSCTRLRVLQSCHKALLYHSCSVNPVHKHAPAPSHHKGNSVTGELSWPKLVRIVPSMFKSSVSQRMLYGASKAHHKWLLSSPCPVWLVLSPTSYIILWLKLNELIHIYNKPQSFKFKCR